MVPEYRYAEPSGFDAGSHSLSAVEPYPTHVFHAGHYSTTPVSPTACVGGVLGASLIDPVESNFDATLHSDKFWLKQESDVAPEHVAESLLGNEVMMNKEAGVTAFFGCVNSTVPIYRN